MHDPVMVYRSSTPRAREDAAKILEFLAGEGIAGELVDDKTPPLTADEWGVRVGADDGPEAEALIALNPPNEDEFANVDESRELDLVTVFNAAGSGSEMEAMSVKGVLDAAGIYAVIVGDPRLPNLPEEVRVPREHVTEAKRVIADAITAGPAGADEAEAAGEEQETR